MIVSIEALRDLAASRVPRWLFDYVDGGAYAETTLRRNQTALETRVLMPRVLRSVPAPDCGVTLFGQEQKFPVMLAPVGSVGMLAPLEGEIAAVRAAAEAGVMSCLSHFSIVPVEDVARSVDPAMLAAQIYVFRDREMTWHMIERIKACGIRTLVITVDTPVTPLRARDARNSFRNRSRLSARHLGQMALRPRWTASVLRSGRRSIGNLASYDLGSDLFAQSAAIARGIDPALGWKDLARVREVWPDRLVVKGVMHPDDAAALMEAGADGIIVSNHGGRQLDGAPASIDVVRDIRKAVGPAAEVIVDGGVRYGADIAKALGEGASGVMIGRPYAWGLACGGARGVQSVLDYFQDGLRSTMTLMGACDLAALRAGGEGLGSQT